MMVNKPPIPNEKSGRAIIYSQGFPGINRNHNIIYPMTEIPCESKKVFFFPILFDIQVTVGITMKVVPNAPKQPNKETHNPVASASPLNNLYTITKKVSAATVLNALNIKNVAIHIFLNSFNLKASAKLCSIFLRLLPILEKKILPTAPQ